MYYVFSADGCTKEALDSLLASRDFLEPKTEDFPIEAGNVLKLRCTNGKVIHTTYDGYFDLTCDGTAFTEPEEWPKAEHCVIDGRPCKLGDAPE